MGIFDSFLLEAILNGLLFGGVLALLALGLNLVFGVIDVVWICYAELIMIGMYTVYFLYSVYGVPLFLAFAACILLVALLGALLHYLVIRPILGSPSRSTSCWSPAASCSSCRRSRRSCSASTSAISACRCRA